MKQRIIVAALLINSRQELLLCRMPPDRGVFPGQWGLPGGGIEPGEKMDDALRREVREEVNLEITSCRPLFFYDDERLKHRPGCEPERVYMIYLVFECQVASEQFTLGEEFCEAVWIPAEAASRYDLNPATRLTLQRYSTFPQASQSTEV